MNMGERIKQLRIANGLTQEELGKYLGVQKSAIRKYEKGSVQNIKRSSIEKMSNLFKVSPSYLMCLEDETKIKNKTFATIPLLSDFQNNLDTSKKNFYLKDVVINDKLPQDTFALQIHDSSMSPLLDINDIAIITENFTFENGQICLISTNDIIMIRKILKFDDYYELQAFNPYYPTEKNKEIDIIGRVIRAENQSAFK